MVGTQTLLDACLRHGIPRIVHIGTDEVYGSIDEGSWDENEPLRPNSPYSAAKAAAELLARAYFVTYGHERLEHPLLEQLRAVPVPGEGHPAVRHQPDRRRHGARCTATASTSATGCTSTTTAAASRWCVEKGEPGESYNIGGGLELNNKELTERVLDAMGADWDRCSRSRTARATTAATRSTTASCARSGTRRSTGSRTAWPRRSQWYRDNEAWWRPLKAKAAIG